MSNAKVLFVLVSACLEYGGNYHSSLQAHKRHGNIKQVLDKSQFNRRLHRQQAVIEELIVLFCSMAAVAGEHYVLDSFLLPVCQNIHIQRCKLVQGSQYHGFCASKQQYYHSFKVHLVTAADGRIVAFELSPGASADTAAFNLFAFNLPVKKNLMPIKLTTAITKSKHCIRMNLCGYGHSQAEF